METIHEPLIMLTPDPEVISANHSFYDRFHVTVKESEEIFIFDAGNHQCDIPVFFLLRGNGFFDIFIKVQ